MQAVLKNYGITVGNSQELRNSCLKNCGIAGHLDERLFSKTVESYNLCKISQFLRKSYTATSRHLLRERHNSSLDTTKIYARLTANELAKRVEQIPLNDYGQWMILRFVTASLVLGVRHEVARISDVRRIHPCALPQVPYQSVRQWQRWGAKPLGQCNRTR